MSPTVINKIERYIYANCTLSSIINNQINKFQIHNKQHNDRMKCISNLQLIVRLTNEQLKSAAIQVTIPKSGDGFRI